eukprot:m.238852 g.238852  ORF g.238852 m.238852 type:complete len:375 (+) comp22080_c0_seq1:91-1215(+)
MQVSWIVLMVGLSGVFAGTCPCSDEKLCEPIQVQYEREVFGFGQSDYQFYDWDVVTTLAWVDKPEVMCEAHAHGARVIAAAPDGMPLTSDKAARTAWINKTIDYVKANFFDGITFDYESPLAHDDPQVGYLTDIVAEATAAFHEAIPGSQVSVCVGWSPDDIDGRAYDYAGLAAASDLLYVMDYDTRSQILDVCIASANAPIGTAQRGLQRFFDLGIAPGKLVLGVPWYGYDYPCLPGTAPDALFCPIREVPFRGINCSDAAGSEVAFSSLMARVDSGARMLTQLRWDNSTQTPNFNYRGDDGAVHQVWFDNPQSLSIKYALAHTLGLRGVGPFMYDYLDNDGKKTRNAKAPAEAAAMWQALHVFSPHKTVVKA